MVLDPGEFIHSADKATLQALKAIPHFTLFLKTFMKVFNGEIILAPIWRRKSAYVRASCDTSRIYCPLSALNSA